MKKLDLEWKGGKDPGDCVRAKKLQDMVDTINELVEEVDVLKDQVKK